MTGENQWPDLEAFAQMDIVEKMEAIHYTDVTEMIRRFDEARKQLYVQIEKVMQGRGGTSRNEALATLDEMRTATAGAYADAGAAIISDSKSLETAIDEVSSLFLADELQRIEKLRELNPAGNYHPLSKEIYDRRIERIVLRADEDSPIGKQLQTHQNQCLSIDFNECLKMMPPNIHEMEALNHMMRKERIKSVAVQLGQMAGAAMIAAVATSFLHKKSK